ncbi:MAG: glycosyl hydrolase 53 family protein [Corallincola sp.]|nr:glycosyl hydrolase 53 family protein [Corallincola sp.]
MAKTRFSSLVCQLLALLLVIGTAGCNSSGGGDSTGAIPQPSLPVRAVDLSFLPSLERAGIRYYDSAGVEGDLVQRLKQAGVTTIRLRLWNDPADGSSSLEEVAAFSDRIRSAGLRTWITIHYSDTWADPGQQQTPAAWQGRTDDELATAVTLFTQEALARLAPDYAQIGNEIDNGLLWPQGQRWQRPDTFVRLLAAGLAGARAGSPQTQLIVHAADYRQAPALFASLAALDYDIAAVSYYPLWHGPDLAALASGLRDIRRVSSKPLLIAETAYPFTLDWQDNTTNVVGEEGQLVPGYSATPEGQLAYLQALAQILTGIDGAIGWGYWGAEWVAWGGTVGGIDGSSWENQTLVDFDRRLLPAVAAFSDSD